MRTIIGTAALLGAVLVGTTTGSLPRVANGPSAAAATLPAPKPADLGQLMAVHTGGTPLNSADISPEALTGVVHRVCAACHNDALKTGNLSLQTFDVAKAPERAETAEKMIMKLRAGMMPPPGVPRPGGDTIQALAATLESILD